VSTLDIIAEVLREVAPRALSAREVVKLARNRLPTTSRTPETVVSRDLAIDVKRHGTASRFLRVDRGEFVLKEALPTAFYNDNDAYAAQWTRNLIEAGELAQGVVDERSVRDLQPADVASFRQCHFFSGIGIWSRALRDAGWPDDFNVWSGSCPCGPFSQAGRKLGFDDDRHLWPDWFRLIVACRPSWIFGEQVSSKDGLAWVDVVRTDLESANYTFRILDTPAACVGAPHKRQRLYFVAYARERGRKILRAPWLHDRGQPGHDALGRGAFDGGDARSVPDSTVTRPQLPEDGSADRGDAIACAEADDRWPAGDLEFERGGDDDDAGGISDAPSGRRHEGSTIGAGCEHDDRAVQDGDRSSAGGVDDAACAVPDAERVVWDEGWGSLPYGREAIEPDRHGEADGSGCGCVRLGDTGLARSGGDTRALSGEEGVGEGERIEARDLAHEPFASGAAHRPGDRIRLDGDPTWGGAVRGYWAEDVEWIYCRPEPGDEDGRWRPTRAGIEPLATRTAADVGRTRAARLRGFGNSIVLPLATAFVESVIDALADAALGIGVEEIASVVIEESPDATKEVA